MKDEQAEIDFYEEQVARSTRKVQQKLRKDEQAEILFDEWEKVVPTKERSPKIMMITTPVHRTPVFFGLDLAKEEDVFKEMSEGLEPYFFTFGYEHKPYGIGYYAVVYAKDAGLACACMHRHFGARWASQYTSADKAGVRKYNLSEIPESPFYAE